MSTDLAKQESGANVASAERTREYPMFIPRFDIFETSNELVMWGDLPGVGPDDIDIDFERGELTVHGRVPPRFQETKFLLAEYGVGDFYRTFAIGEVIDGEKISAELKNGVLTVHLPKTEAVKPRKIAVQAE